ncbi:hypothetical protein OHS70_38130 [Streptomyces sp. NBC_00390]|uniref:hypothetical protein n=1 Tax=Streptomyces sp. NBC_00390 TaxID=2975736 RepID=UPI002E1E9395
MRKRTVAIITTVGAAAAAVTGMTYVPAAATGSRGGGDQYGYARDYGQIQVNERTYSANPGACITVFNTDFTLRLGFNIRNDTRRTVEFFNGFTCDSGAAAARVGPRTSTTVTTEPVFVRGLLNLPAGTVGSFRVVDEGN